MITRERVHPCPRGGTYKYFVPVEEMEAVWLKLEAAYGPRVRNAAMKTIQVESTCFIFRSTFVAKPLTVIRKRACTDAAVTAMHALVGFDGP
jgi:hypothetical protein